MAGLFDEEIGGLVVYWKTIPAIAARVGSHGNARIMADQARQKWNGQFILYTLAPGGEVYQHLMGTTGARLSIVHVYAWGDSRSDANALCEAIKLAMQSGFARTWWNGVYINRCQITDPPDGGCDPPLGGDDAKKFWSRLVLRITHTEAGGT